MNTQRNGLTTEQALDQLKRLYDDAVEALRNAILAFTASGTLPDAGLRQQGGCLSIRSCASLGRVTVRSKIAPASGDALPTPAATAPPSHARRCCATISANSFR